MRLVAHVGSSRRSRSTTVLSSILITAAAVGARVISAVSRAGIWMRRLRRMSVLVMGVIIGRGTLKTDTIILLGGLSLPLRVIR